MASQADLRKLWYVVLTQLILKLTTGKPTASLLDTSRRFMAQSGFTGPAPTPIVRKRLAKLQLAYVEALRAAMAAGNPPASILSEVREYLLQTETTLSQLGSDNKQDNTFTIDVPFTIPH